MGVSSLFSLCEFQGLNSGLQAWWQAPLWYGPSRWTLKFPFHPSSFNLILSLAESNPFSSHPLLLISITQREEGGTCESFGASAHRCAGAAEQVVPKALVLQFRRLQGALRALHPDRRSLRTKVAMCVVLDVGSWKAGETQAHERIYKE